MSAEATGLDILMVEDDLALAEMYRITLEAGGHLVRIAADGRHGLREALDRPPQLLLLDIRLPGLSGLDLLARLRRDPRAGRVPVILLTNFDQPDLVRRGAELGALAHLVKSQTTPAELMETFRHLVPAGAAETTGT